MGEELYNKVQEAITEKFQDKTIKEIIKEVIDGKYGIGEERQLKLGYTNNLCIKIYYNKINLFLKLVLIWRNFVCMK